ncbi:GntR family transcriptional regulator [Amycolatopsis roodepoortensis]|uniref:DNA-binding GntR family transcriptional regulator n=1 Tax=Amycolatopsis roodepoortensis TaxID=700274 RepID=A0ABR9L350_9PSEU|nr:GntR family transcriptional regulator [Amycolatopsis roodepoortensis]MBE1574528.1 DNA-binding GntR family transcriptional regulator [Amycolatopsis roodepoortensis]
MTVTAEGGGPARERVYTWLRDGIISGELEGGRFLDEMWVSGVVGVSRTPVREAFHRLAAERFISLLPRKGAQVRTVTARELEEVYQSRRLIEGHAIAALCANRAGAPAELPELIEAMVSSGAERDWFAVSGFDRRFHRAIVNAAGNTVLTELYDTLRSRQQRVTVRALEARPERLTVINEEHRALVAALNAHDVKEASRLLEEHLRPVSEVMSALPQEG